MATGASTADVAILLVDARHGVRVQSRRHAQIARLLGITDYVLAVNKMDLVDFDRDVFDDICDEFDEILPDATLHPIPMSALHGDNVITRSDRTPWFDGRVAARVPRDRRGRSQRRRRSRSGFPVQLVLAARPRVPRLRRPDRLGHRPAGRRRHRLAVRPHRRASSASSPGTATSTWRTSPMSVTLTLEDEIDISRGDMIGDRRRPRSGQRFKADVVWMDERPLDPVARLPAEAHDADGDAPKSITALVLNQIGSVTVSTARPLIFDRYADNRGTGSFILIDPATNFTAGAGMITEAVRERHRRRRGQAERRRAAGAAGAGGGAATPRRSRRCARRSRSC